MKIFKKLSRNLTNFEIGRHMPFNHAFDVHTLLLHKSLEGTECPTVDIEIYNKRKKRDCSETIIN